MNVSKERLAIIGKLIGIYREERRHNTQNEFTQKRFCEGICSPNTLKSIEAGGLSRFEDVYTELLHKFGLKLDEFPAIDEAIRQVVEELYAAIEFFDRNKIEILTDKMLRVLSKVKEYVYYSEIWELMKNVQNYFININVISDIEVIRYIELIDVVKDDYTDLIKLLVFMKEKNLCSINKSEYLKAVERINLCESKRNFITILLLHYYFVLNDYLKMHNLVLDLESKFMNVNNYVRLLDIYNYAVVLHSYIETDKIELYIDKIENIILLHKFPEIKIAEVYSSIASSLHKSKKYNTSLEYYEKMLQNYNNNYILKFIYMADCQNRLGLEINIPIVDEQIYKRFPINLRLMYKYFTLDKDTPEFIKQNYIMKKILPTLENEVNIDIFRYELGKLIEKTGHYKNMHIFDCVINTNSAN